MNIWEKKIVKNEIGIERKIEKRNDRKRIERERDRRMGRGSIIYNV